mgnify:CR=1 FL=1|tara:strand:+ start:4893 stop:6554 length:1662 start_codon:yes stop_codon:yes gene_type:complete
MALNPFFLQGSQSEQRLIQELINEQLTIYGVEVIYLPRKIVNQDTVLNEIQSSKFDDNYAIEAYVNTYEGYGGAGDIMTKFGMSLKDDLTVTISKERFEDFIAPFLGEMSDDEINVSGRPREGDLIYFPLGERLFEVKFVEHEQPFYQLGKNYVYQLKCELFEYSDELGGWDQLSTTTEEIDSVLEDQGYITSILMIGAGTKAQAIAHNGTGYIRKIFLNDDGNGYTSTPIVSISTSPNGNTLANATAVAITTTSANVQSVKEILLTNAGFGYTESPTISIIGGGGTGAIATCSIETTEFGLTRFDVSPGSGYPIPPVVAIGTPTGAGAAATAIISDFGTVIGFNISTGGKFYKHAPQVSLTPPDSELGLSATAIALVNSGIVTGFTITFAGDQYSSPPTVSIANTFGDKDFSSSGLTTAVVRANVSAENKVTSIHIEDPGLGYNPIQTVTIADPPTTGIGTFIFNEIVTGSISGATARVKTWNKSDNILKVGTTNGTFVPGDVIVGSASSAKYSVDLIQSTEFADKYDKGEQIETLADTFLDFTETNPFGTY